MLTHSSLGDFAIKTKKKFVYFSRKGRSLQTEAARVLLRGQPLVEKESDWKSWKRLPEVDDRLCTRLLTPAILAKSCEQAVVSLRWREVVFC